MSTKIFDVYKCEVCGNIVEVIHSGAPSLTCCNKPMKLLTENTVDASKEKHVPVVERTADRVHVKVGSVAHPMEEKHYIEFIEIIDSKGNGQIRFLKPGEKPEAEFLVKEGKITAREYCNLHGLWKS